MLFEPNINKLETKKDVKGLVKALDHKNIQIRQNAAKALGNIGPDARSAVETLTFRLGLKHEYWKDGDEELIRNIIVALGKIGPDAKDAVPILFYRFDYFGREARHSIVQIMGIEGASEAEAKYEAENFANSLKNDYCNYYLSFSGIETHSDAVDRFVKMSPLARSIMLPSLIDLLKDKDSDTRKHVCCVLVNMGTLASAAVPALIKILQDKDDGRALEHVAWALGAIGPKAKDAVPELINLLKSRDVWVRIRTVRALGSIGADVLPAIPYLTEMLGDDEQWSEDSPPLRYYVAESINKLKP